MKKEEKSYKDFEKVYIGSSDIASLIARFCYAKTAKIIEFGGDDDYHAYFVNQKIKMPKYYKLVASGKVWLNIFDDRERTFSVRAKFIRIYRCGDYGIIIYAPDGVLTD